jgi:hypothetical protein
MSEILIPIQTPIQTPIQILTNDAISTFTLNFQLNPSFFANNDNYLSLKKDQITLDELINNVIEIIYNFIINYTIENKLGRIFRCLLNDLKEDSSLKNNEIMLNIIEAIFKCILSKVDLNRIRNPEDRKQLICEIEQIIKFSYKRNFSIGRNINNKVINSLKNALQQYYKIESIFYNNKLIIIN